MKLNDNQVENILNALRIAAEACDRDAQGNLKWGWAALARESAARYRALATLIETTDGDLYIEVRP
jgi:hypothetical protein